MTSISREEAPAPGDHGAAPSLKRVITSSAIGQFVEFYDFVIYAYSAAVLAKLFFPSEDPVAGVLSVFAVYAVGFAIRPIGGIVFGLLGDKIGRRRVLVLVIVMMGAGTMAIGLLPTYEQIGILAPVLLVLCRLLQGFSAAGETMTSNAFVAEHSPRGKRGLYVSFTYSFTTLPSVAAAIIVWALIAGLGTEAYESWGWRIAFLIGGPMALVGLYIRSKISESPVFEAAKAAEDETQVARSSSKKAIIQALALSAVGALGFYTLSGYMVSYLTTTVELPQDQALISNGIALTIAFVSFWLGGALGDRFGRRPVLFAMIAAAIVLYLPAFWLAGNATFWGALTGQSVIGVIFGMFYGVFAVRILESFSTHNRVSGTVICFNVSYTVFGGTAPLISTWLITQTGLLFAPAIYMVVLAVVVLLVVIALKMPETAGRSMLHADDVGGSPELQEVRH
ncbi:MHS family MFS transporter [Kocuria coralli]|uniref:Putative proline/betaine transporter n=1 Tax=Kocuria coralli TaxID=1461025 RepID=A0A5J5KYH9_9MICC|nr:MFS transporter [Kocuria coralli]KAA9394817.1 MHS family MFS transporter [Kocuria coralli]